MAQTDFYLRNKDCEGMKTLMIIDWICNKFFRKTIYVKIRSDLLSVYSLENNVYLEDKPVVAMKIDDKSRRMIVAVGSDAEKSVKADRFLKLCNGFDHPRSCVGDHEIARGAIAYFISRALKSRVSVRFILIIHPLEKLEGGLTNIECKYLIDMGCSVGARQVYIWTGDNLTPDELKNLQFPKSKGRLWADYTLDSKKRGF